MGKLYLVATPIGNLEDISLRALRVLQEVHMVACEDTRHTQVLLRKHEIRAKHLTSYTEFNHRRKSAELVGQLDRGWDVALVTDAGTPGLSDPGEQLVKAAIAAGHEVVPIPGPAAAIAALVAHQERPDRAGRNDAAGEGRLLDDHEGVQRIAVSGQRLHHESVVRGIVDRGEEHSVEADAAGLLVELVLLAGAPRDLDEDVKALILAPAPCHHAPPRSSTAPRPR